METQVKSYNIYSTVEIFHKPGEHSQPVSMLNHELSSALFLGRVE